MEKIIIEIDTENDAFAGDPKFELARILKKLAAKIEYGKQPEHLRDSHYAGHERIDDTSGYLYPHDYPGNYVEQNYMPEGFEDKVYYQPGKLGDESEIFKKKDQNGLQ